MRFLTPSTVITAIQITPGQKVADFGSGRGEYVFDLANKVTNSGIVYAIDIHKALLTKISKEATLLGLQNVRTLWADIEQPGGTGIETSSLDIAIVSNTLFQAEDKDLFLTEIYRTLKIGGKVLMIDWKSELSPKEENKDNLMEESIDLFKKHNFTFTQSVPAGSHHFGFICTKV